MAQQGNNRPATAHHQTELGRRGFFGKAAAGAALFGAVSGEASASQPAADQAAGGSSLPREVCIATVSQDGLNANTPEQVVAAMLNRCEQAASQRPDLVCLPEVCPCLTVPSSSYDLNQVAGSPMGPLTRPFAEFAAKHRCYVVCPTYTQQDGKKYNSAVLLDRKGDVVGVYHKIRITPNEVELGLTPGPETPPVFDTDFGKLGIQICFDIEWPDAWRSLRDQGAEIVVWPSAFAGGRMINSMAYTHRYAVVSSTGKDTSKICDVDGTQLAATSRWNRWAATTVNLEKVFLHTWPFVTRFGEIQAKYGPKIRITTHPEEEWSVIESRSPDVRVADLIDEFELEQIDDYLARAAALQQQARG